MGFLFRRADFNDIEGILSIIDSHLNNFGDKGFLVGKQTYKDIICILKDQSKQIFILEEDNEIVGYLLLIKKFNKPVLEFDFVDNKYIKYFDNHNFYCISQVAVKRDKLNKRIGHHLYENLFNLYPKHLFVASVITKPVFNTASYKFHKKHGFRVIGHLNKKEYSNLKNYQCALFYKETF